MPKRIELSHQPFVCSPEMDVYRTHKSQYIKLNGTNMCYSTRNMHYIATIYLLCTHRTVRDLPSIFKQELEEVRDFVLNGPNTVRISDGRRRKFIYDDDDGMYVTPHGTDTRHRNYDIVTDKFNAEEGQCLFDISNLLKPRFEGLNVFVSSENVAADQFLKTLTIKSLYLVLGNNVYFSLRSCPMSRSIHVQFGDKEGTFEDPDTKETAVIVDTDHLPNMIQSGTETIRLGADVQSRSILTFVEQDDLRVFGTWWTSLLKAMAKRNTDIYWTDCLDFFPNLDHPSVLAILTAAHQLGGYVRQSFGFESDRIVVNLKGKSISITRFTRSNQILVRSRASGMFTLLNGHLPSLTALKQERSEFERQRKMDEVNNARDTRAENRAETRENRFKIARARQHMAGVAALARRNEQQMALEARRPGLVRAADLTKAQDDGFACAAGNRKLESDDSTCNYYLSNDGANSKRYGYGDLGGSECIAKDDIVKFGVNCYSRNDLGRWFKTQRRSMLEQPYMYANQDIQFPGEPGITEQQLDANGVQHRLTPQELAEIVVQPY